MDVSGDFAASYEEAHPGTLYWTVSLYIPAERLSQALSLPFAGRHGSRQIVEPATWRKLVTRHRCSLVLGGAMDPLFNDIADRDVQGTAQEFLIAAMADPPDSRDAMQVATKQVLDEIHLTFTPPASVEWMTEGRRYLATPPGLSEPRSMTLKRFWFAHYGGALSYHLSFCYRYKPLEGEAGPLGDGYLPANYYFLSMLQKLVAPKELSLPPESFLIQTGDDELKRSVFENTQIKLLDHPIVKGLSPSRLEATPFWHGLAERFNEDAQEIIRSLAKSMAGGCRTAPPLDLDWRMALLDDQPVIEVSGLRMPRCRFMFFFHDERFFGRMMPVNDDGATIERKAMVREDCYKPYLETIARLRRETETDPVSLDDRYWHWVGGRAADYAQWCTDGTIVPDEGVPFETPAHWALAIRSGRCLLTVGDDGHELDLPVPMHVPAYEAGRTDCLDYLFLSGFNQNIIDFMNQDTSEILDSTDPLYPEKEDQADERFFVRFANHRALITYVPSSRSLEIGNDYIGTCPYAFLIHVLAMHNEYLDRLHETATAKRLKDIKDTLMPGDVFDRSLTESLDLELLNQAERDINNAKLAHFYEYQQYRYLNPFRYDTESDVFAKLEKLRGTSRKQQALQAALASLEDHARDLGLQNRMRLEDERRRAADDEAEQRKKDEAYEKRVQNGLSILGIFGILQMIWSVVSFKVERTKGLSLYLFHVGEAVTAREQFVALLSLAFTFAVIVYLARLVTDGWIRGMLIAGMGIALLGLIYEIVPNPPDAPAGGQAAAAALAPEPTRRGSDHPPVPNFQRTQ